MAASGQLRPLYVILAQRLLLGAMLPLDPYPFEEKFSLSLE